MVVADPQGAELVRRSARLDLAVVAGFGRHGTTRRPAREQARANLEWPPREIRDGGEAALICEASLVDGLSDEEVEAMFNAACATDHEAPVTGLCHASKATRRRRGRVRQSLSALPETARLMVTGDEWWRLLPPGTSGDALHVLAARGVRAFADGFVALLLPIYLVEIGFNSLAVGAIVASTLVGTALLTLWVGMIANRHSRRMLLLAASVLMAATGVAFATVSAFWPLLIIAFVGTINPTSGDASIFQPLEQTVLTQTITPRRRTALFARYSVIGSLAGAAGVLAAAIPDLASARYGFDRVTAIRAMFVAYGLFGVASMILFRPLSNAVEAEDEAPKAPLGQSRRLVYGLAALFGMDSLGTGFLLQSLLALWLYQAFHVSVTATATILFWSGVCSAVSYLIAVPIAERIGLINTMVFTHLPSNLFLMMVPFAPDLASAVGLLLARSALSQMDVPTRASYVMAVVSPEERPAAASVTSVPKPFAWATGSIVSGYLLTLSGFGWPLLIGGAIKAGYDILLLIKFREVRPPEEQSSV